MFTSRMVSCRKERAGRQPPGTRMSGAKKLTLNLEPKSVTVISIEQ